MYVGSIMMGYSTELDVVYDTGSDWLVIEGSSCVTCQGDKYDITDSLLNGHAYRKTISSSEREYGSAKVVGREYTDTVCIGLRHCVNSFRFFLVEQQEGL